MRPINRYLKDPPCFTLENALTPREAAEVVRHAEAAGFTATGRRYPASYRDNDRLVIDDRGLADRLFSRMRPHLPETVIDDDGTRWTLAGLNERFRFCRYRDGQSFRVHRDGVHFVDEAVRSKLTFMVYLNGASEFRGGATRFYRNRRPDGPPDFAIAPRQGSLVVFDHTLWHDGQPVTAGTKYVMRSDVLYRRDGVAETAGHLGYVWNVIQLADGRLATGGRDRTVRIWRRRGDDLESAGPALCGHHNSVCAFAQAIDGSIWSGDRNGTVRVWSADGRDEAAFSAHAGAVLALQPVARGVVSAGADGAIHVWTEPNQCDTTLPGHRDWVWDLALTSTGRIVSASEDGEVRSWDRSGGHRRLASGQPARAVCLLPGGMMAVGRANGEITLLGRGGERSLRGHTEAVRALAPRPGGRLASGGEDDRVIVWDLRSGTRVGDFEHGDFVTSLATLSDGRLASASYDGSVRVWPICSWGICP